MTKQLALRDIMPGSNTVQHIGPHVYVWDADCDLPDDGATVICPTCLTSESMEVMNTGWQNLSANSIIFGSVVVQFNGYQWSDWQHHGHTNVVAGSNPAAIDHASGGIFLPVAGGEQATVSYYHANSVGRWVKQFAPGEPLPLSLLGTPALMSNYEAICWSLNLAYRLGRELLVDGEYYHCGGTIEIPDGMVIRGTRGAAIKIDADNVMDRFRLDLGNLTPKWGIDKPYLAGYESPLVTHKPDCSHFEIHGVEFNGGALSWEGWNNGDFEDPLKFDQDELSQSLRESPTYCGLGITNQNNRPVDVSVVLRDVKIHNFMGSCLLTVNDPQWDTENLSCGNSVSGRVFYNGSGRHKNLRLFGFSRNGVARVGDAVVDGFTYENNGSTNPWPDNSPSKNIVGTEDSDRVEFQDAYLDLSGAQETVAFSGGARCVRISGVISNAETLWAYNDNLPGVNAVDMEMDVAFGSTNDIVPALVDCELANGACISRLNLNASVVVAGYDPPTFPITNYNEWLPKVANPSKIKVARVSGSPERQYIKMHLNDPIYRFVLLWIPDLAPGGVVASDIVPTVVELSGVVHNTHAHLLATAAGVTQSSPVSYENAPVLVRCKDLTFDFRGGGPFIGNDFPRSQLEIMSFENCKTWQGKQSEDGGTVAVPVEGITIDTKLFTEPVNTRVSDGVTYEWVGTETNPQLQLTPTSGAVTVTWEADFRK